LDKTCLFVNSVVANRLPTGSKKTFLEHESMATNQMSEVIRQLRTVLIRDGAGLTDGELLRRFLGQQDDAALAALVRRHGPMVWGVCRRLLRSPHDAENAFQATFLVFVRKAAALQDKESVADWLYGVAHRTVVHARATASKYGAPERRVAERPELENDPLPLLDRELIRLPAKYRALIVLCDLEGKPRKDVARQLGCAEGLVAGRLARARVMLAKRLNRRGLTISGGALAMVLSREATPAPTYMVAFTIKAARLLATGQEVSGSLISAQVVTLMEGVVKAMFATKIKSVMAVVLIVVLALGAAWIGMEMFHTVTQVSTAATE
jgi:RNA polymerase sigma factor (sigma-70 family)